MTLHLVKRTHFHRLMVGKCSVTIRRRLQTLLLLLRRRMEVCLNSPHKMTHLAQHKRTGTFLAMEHMLKTHLQLTRLRTQVLISRNQQIPLVSRRRIPVPVPLSLQLHRTTRTTVWRVLTLYLRVQPQATLEIGLIPHPLSIRSLLRLQPTLETKIGPILNLHSLHSPRLKLTNYLLTMPAVCSVVARRRRSRLASLQLPILLHHHLSLKLMSRRRLRVNLKPMYQLIVKSASHRRLPSLRQVLPLPR